MSDVMGSPHLTAARRALASGDADEAVHHAKRHLLDSREDADALRILFKSYQRLGRSDDASLVGRRLVKAAPTDFSVRLETARLELELGRSRQVIRLLTGHAGEDRAATALLAEAYERAGKAALAASLRDAIPGADWVGYRHSGSEFQRLYFTRQLCTLLRNRVPESSHREQIISALEDGRYPEAGALLREWFQRSNDDVSRLALTDWWLLSGQVTQARTTAEQRGADQNLAGAWQNRLGDIAQAEGDYEKARAHYRKATILEPHDSNAWLDLARTEFLRGDQNAAVEACEQVLDLAALEEEQWLAEEFLEELTAESSSGTLEPGLYGLVWWERGGGLLEVEVARRDESDGLLLTGNVGRALEDAARVAFQFAKSELECFENAGAHIHFPGFRVPKDGGSAGLLLALMLYGLDAGREPVDRVAVTGELTLRGNVLPIGGLREKVTAAHLHGADRVILPADNTTDLLTVSLMAKRSLEFVQVRTFDAVLSSLTW